MYWHGAQEDTRRTVNKIIADRAMGILVVTGIGYNPALRMPALLAAISAPTRAHITA